MFLRRAHRHGPRAISRTRAERALGSGLRGRPRGWLAIAVAMGLAAVWVVVVTLSFGRTSDQRQQTFMASRDGSNMLTSMLVQDGALRGYAATGDRKFLATLGPSARQVARSAHAARRAMSSQPDVVASVGRQLTLAATWEQLAHAVSSHGRPRASQLAPGATLAMGLAAFRAENSRFQSLVENLRVNAQRVSNEEALVMALIVSVLILVAGAKGLQLLGRADARLRTLVDRSLDLITVVDAAGIVAYQSPAIARVLGYETPTKIGTPVTDLLDPQDATVMLERLRRAQSDTEPTQAAECRWRHADGSVRWLETVCNNLLDDANVRGIVLNSRDVTERRQLSEQLRLRAFHDPLTGLANRARLEERLERMLRRANGAVALLFIDLDNFKNVNDSLGHGAGDRFLKEVADRLAACVRTGDTVARMGGDEFAVLVFGVDASLRAPRIAARILESLKAPIELERREITAGASIGITVGRVGQDVQEILRDADLALYDAKHRGKNQVQLYRPALHSVALQRLELDTDLRAALERKELLLYYQPLYRLRDGRLAGYEALIRWQHPRRGLLLPDSFIELAEQSRLIVPLTRWALRSACIQTAEWQRRAGRSLEIAVNLSFVNLQDERIVADVASALSASGIAPSELVLEITETTVTDHHATTSRILRDLKHLGVRLALDDFGTGYSSLSRLSALPFDTLKIPRPFIDGIERNPMNLALTQGIVDLGHRLDLSVVAEGIETQPQLAHVTALGFELAQGFHLATPAAVGATDPQQDLAPHTSIVVPYNADLTLVDGMPDVLAAS